MQISPKLVLWRLLIHLTDQRSGILHPACQFSRKSRAKKKFAALIKTLGNHLIKQNPHQKSFKIARLPCHSPWMNPKKSCSFLVFLCKLDWSDTFLSQWREKVNVFYCFQKIHYSRWTWHPILDLCHLPWFPPQRRVPVFLPSLPIRTLGTIGFPSEARA